MSKSNKSPHHILSQSLPNLIHNLADVEKGRSGVPQPSNVRGIREDEDTNLLAKTISVCDVPGNSRTTMTGNEYANSSQMAPAHANRMSSLIWKDVSDDDSKRTFEGRNSFQLIHEEVEQDLQRSLFGTTILAGDKEMKGEVSFQKLQCLSDLDMPLHIQDFKRQYERAEENRIKLPLLTQLSPRTRKQISLLPKSSEMQQKKIAEYGQIGIVKKSPVVAVSNDSNVRTMNLDDFTKSTQKSNVNKNTPLFKQLGEVILKNKNLQYRKNAKDSIGKFPAPVILSDQVKALGKLKVSHDSLQEDDNSSQYDHLQTEATQVCSFFTILFIISCLYSSIAYVDIIVVLFTRL